MTDALPSFLQTNEIHSRQGEKHKKTASLPIDRTLKKAANLIKSGTLQNEFSVQDGLMQKIDARAKTLFLFFFMVIISLVKEIPTQLAISLIFLILYTLSHIRLFEVYKKILILSFLFGFIVVAPAALNLITGREIIIPLIRFRSAQQVWIYHIPSIVGITREGSFFVLRFYLKVLNSLTLTFLIFYTTPFNKIIKSMKIFRVPGILLLIITLAFKFIFVLAQTIEETYFAMKLRWWEQSGENESTRLITGRIAYIFRKSWIKYEEVYMAMTARGFSGDTNLCYLRKVEWPDILFLSLSLLAGIIILCFFI
ncbi:MAG: energy-coupling factor transporter transmembrane component T [Bacteroidota bacterium]|nr:energy-coupling factor transporter transmembrane component T [Bacteroidota bacterium]